MRTQSRLIGVLAVLLLPNLCPAQSYTKWAYQPDSNRHICEYRYERRDGRSGVQYAVTYSKADKDRYGWVYYYNADQKPWARCATVGHPKYDAKAMYWQKLNPDKSGYEDYAEKAGYCPTPGDGYAPIPPIPPPPPAPEVPGGVGMLAHTPWQYDPEKARHVCEYRYRRTSGTVGVQYAVAYTKANKDQYGWVYYYSPDATPWGRCATVGHPKYDEKQPYWQKLKPSKDGYEDYSEKPGFAPKPADGLSPIPAVAAPPEPASALPPPTLLVPAPDEAKGNRIAGLHQVSVREVPKDTKTLQMWFWLPMETPYQKVGTLTIKGVYALTDAEKYIGDPATRIPDAKHWEVRDGNHRYLYVEIAKPPTNFAVGYDFNITRSAIPPKLKGVTKLDTAFPAGYEKEFAQYLDLSPASGIRVTERLRKERDLLFAGKTDKLELIQTIFAKAAGYVHYNRPSNKIKRAKDDPTSIFSTVSDDEPPIGSGKVLKPGGTETTDQKLNGSMDTPDAGDPESCILQLGGGCTDIHTTVLYLARSAGIPARLQFGSRVDKSKTEAYTPGYRCLIEYWLPGYGWIPMDCAQAGNSQENNDGTLKPEAERAAVKELYFSGMDDSRLSFVEGRNVVLKKHTGEPVYTAPLFIGAWVLADGNKHKNFVRTFTLSK